MSDLNIELPRGIYSDDYLLSIGKGKEYNFHKGLYSIVKDFSGNRVSRIEMDMGEKKQIQMSYSTEIGFVNICYTFGNDTEVRVNIPGGEKKGDLTDRINSFVDSNNQF